MLVSALTAFADPRRAGERGSRAGGSDKTLRVWDASKGRCGAAVVAFDDDEVGLGGRARHERALRGFWEAVGGVAHSRAARRH